VADLRELISRLTGGEEFSVSARMVRNIFKFLPQRKSVQHV